MDESAVLALQRSLVGAALGPDPSPLARDPAGFARDQGLPPGDQAAFVRFRDRLLVYRRLVRDGLAEPVTNLCMVTHALLEGEGAWDACMDGFLAARNVASPFYRDVVAAFVTWLAETGWGRERWPYLLPLAHFELMDAMVARHPGGSGDPDLHLLPRLGDLLVLAAPTQLLTYPWQVHRATEEKPVPDPGQIHLLAYRDAGGIPRWMELTPATAALLLAGQKTSVGQAALDLGLEDLTEMVDLLADLQVRGALQGFAPAAADALP
jgi:hypothetical protein